MATARQIEANRRNARRSRGPQTAQGKARVAQNALAHGLLSRETLLPDEDPQVLQELAVALRTQWAPQGPQEELSLDMMLRAVWRLRRLGRVEAGIFAVVQSGILAHRAEKVAGTYEERALTELGAGPEPARIMDPEQHQHALAEAAQMRARRYEGAALMGLTFMHGSRGVDAFAKLSRYEASIERSYLRALHELQRLQLARGGGQVPAPVAVDVTISGTLGGPDDPSATA